jgi:mRNA interferase RelE/StbE
VAEYSLSIKPSAIEEIEAISTKRDRQRIVRRITVLATEPRPPGCEKLTGATSMYRVRQGQYRIIYLVDDAARSVDVLKVGHRREVYRRGL